MTGVLRWALLLPVAVVAAMVGSIAGGLVASVLGQAAADTGSAFFGPFMFVFAAALVAPSHRQNVCIAAAALIALLAMGTFVLSTFTGIEEFAQLPQRARILSPVAQVLGALYASFICLPFLTPGATLETLWRQILALGSLAGMVGAALGVVGLVVALATDGGWFVFQVGVGVLALAVVTWLFPFVHPLLRARKAGRVFEAQMREHADKQKSEP